MIKIDLRLAALMAIPRFHRPIHQYRALHQQPGGLRPPVGHRLRASHHRLVAPH